MGRFALSPTAHPALKFDVRSCANEYNIFITFSVFSSSRSPVGSSANRISGFETSARTIAIRPLDKKAIRDIEKAIMDSDVGITPENNGEIIRLGIPQPTEERRKELVKQCNKIGEKAKVEVRNVRGEIKDKLKKAIKDGLSEDNEKDAELELQKIHDKFIKKLDDLLAAKQKEIMTV
jgi:ribosome recycling factor